jgi:hypothetical protein
MTMFRSEGFSSSQKKRKYGSTISLTHEAIADILGLPEDVEILEACSDDRDILTFRLKSQEKSKLTYELGEGQLAPQIGNLPKLYIKQAIKNLKALEAGEGTKIGQKAYEEALKELAEEEADHA